MADKEQITPEQLGRLKSAISTSLAADRSLLINDFPFTGGIAMRFQLIPVRDVRCRTACTDGRSIYFDCEFYASLSSEERRFVLAHEIWHNVMLHLARKQRRDPELFNIATDMEVNALLRSHQEIGSCMATPPHMLMPPQELKGKSAEEIYEWVVKQYKAGKDPLALLKNGDKSGDGSGKSCSGQFDKHVYSEDEIEQKDGQAEGSGVSDRWGEVGFDPDFRPRMSKDYAERMRDAVVQSSTQYTHSYGALPADVSRIVDKFMKPEINWKEVLATFVSQCYGGSRKWLPPNRRHVHNDMYFQSRRAERLNVAVAIDTSGSTCGEIPKFFSELKGIVDSFGSYTIHLIQCDCQVDSYEMFDDGNPLEFEKAEAKGGGGTSFDPPFEYIQEHGILADCIIYVTDGYAPKPRCKKPECPVLWLITKHGNTNVSDWGKVIQFNESSEGRDY